MSTIKNTKGLLLEDLEEIVAPPTFGDSPILVGVIALIIIATVAVPAG